jgi:hypothetical protein
MRNVKISLKSSLLFGLLIDNDQCYFVPPAVVRGIHGKVSKGERSEGCFSRYSNELEVTYNVGRPDGVRLVRDSQPEYRG